MRSSKEPYRFELDVERIGDAELSFELALVPWDSDAFGFSVGQVAGIQAAAPPSQLRSHAALAELARWIDEHGVRMMSSRLAHDQLRESMLLEDQGFRFVEMVYGMSFDQLADADLEAPLIDVQVAGDDDVEALRRIGAAAFETGRFNIDPRLDAELGGRRYAAWVDNAMSSASQRVVKAVVDGRVAGFFIYEQRPDASCYWHLTAIAPEFQGQGIGRRLWRAMLRMHRAEGVLRVETTVSARNVPVLNLYARLGFRFGTPQMTFHWVRS